MERRASSTSGDGEAGNLSGYSINSRRQERKPKRTVTIYDAVAGRVSAGGYITEASASQNPAFPEHVLFRSVNAPELTEERDVDLDTVYWASDRLQADQRLPNSDLLKALHEYSSDFYSKTTTDRGVNDFKSLDGTALLALGVLLEETCKQTLGETGDFAFLEAGGNDTEIKNRTWVKGRWIPNVLQESIGALREESQRWKARRPASSRGLDPTDLYLRDRFLPPPPSTSHKTIPRRRGRAQDPQRRQLSSKFVDSDSDEDIVDRDTSEVRSTMRLDGDESASKAMELD